MGTEMKMDIKTLDTLFRKVPSEEVWKELRSQQNLTSLSFEGNGKEWFHRFAAESFSGFSEDEQELIFLDSQQKAERWKMRITQEIADFSYGDCQSFPEFAVLFIGRSADKMLRLCGQEPRCQINEVLNWREAFLRMGQDLFVCAFLAKEDVKAHRIRQQFAWPAVIRTDYVPLNKLLERGLAENHQHLLGSSQTFALTWMDLMNFPEDHSGISNYIRWLRQPITVDSISTTLLTLEEKVRIACVLRLYLFWGMAESLGRDVPEFSRNGLNINNPDIGRLTTRLQEALRQYPMLKSFHTDISYARNAWGANVPQINGNACVLDYALTENIFAKASEEPYRALCGERAFLYHSFRLFYEGKMDTTVQWAFYLYILLKLQFRGELIQVNSKIGFANFGIYQSRKTKLFQYHSGYKAELIRMALVAPLKREHVSSLETRISPKNTPEKNNILITRDIERLRCFAEAGRADMFSTGGVSNAPKPFCDSSDVFYVFHFIKSKDNKKKEDSLLVSCRHFKKRQEVRKQAIAIAKAISTYEIFGSKVRGIDSAANEIGCPPEVFANAYRFLRNYSESDYRNSFSIFPVGRKMLSATYHVGEDFLDIASALRSIDETVSFLELQRGDRIGHALGLGILPSIHYELKNYRIFLRKQDRLDDLIWLLYRGRELGTRIDPDLYGNLKKEAETLLMEIYRPVFEVEKWTISLTDYHCIMQLRGDDPACYRTGRFVPPSKLETQYEEYAISYRDEARNEYRQNTMFANFYYYYHYDYRVKQKGNEVCSVEIKRDYMDLIQQCQDKLQLFLQEKGIIVECNPSSNTLIGTFRNYANHPVFRLHQTGLHKDTDSFKPHGDMQVCINTDDLGVFDTSLEFEFALLFQALNDQKKSDGSRCFSEEEILNYLEHLREMGHWAIFPKDNS